MRVDWSVNLLLDPSSIEGFVTYWAQAAYYKQENEVDDYHRVDIKEERHPDTNEVLSASINVTDTTGHRPTVSTQTTWNAVLLRRR